MFYRPQLLRLYFSQISNNAWENPSKKSPSPQKKGFTFKQVKQFFTSEHFYCAERTNSLTMEVKHSPLSMPSHPMTSTTHSLAKQNNNIQIFGFSVRFGSVPSFNSGVDDVNGWNAFGNDGVNPSANMKKSQLNQRCTLFRHPLDPWRWMERFPKGLISSHILRIQCNRHGEK